MNTRKSNKLPDGVGKKIVEALKKQSGAVNKIQAEEKVSSFDDLISAHISENESEIVSSKKRNQEWEEEYQDVNINVHDDYENESYSTSYEDNEITETEDFRYHEVMDETDLDSYDYYNNAEDDNESDDEIYEEEIEEDDEQEVFVPARQRMQRGQKPLPQQKIQRKYNVEKPMISKSEPIGLQVETSSNIEVLMGLVSQLPSGVTRQTGAQIIRQTMEAIGFSMNKVLKEAQFAQDELAQAIRDNINTIEEYRNNIKILEKDVQKYRRKAEELEDLISLFILSEKERKK